MGHAMKRPIPPADLVHELVVGMADIANVTADDVYAPDRHKAVSWARAMVCRWLRAHDAGYSLTGIGEAMGLDHSSVLHALNRDISPNHPYARRVKRHSNPLLGKRIEAIVNSRAQIRTSELASILDVNSNNISESISKLWKKGRVRRVRTGVYAPMLARVALPPALPPPCVIESFIRPIPLSRMMAGR